MVHIFGQKPRKREDESINVIRVLASRIEHVIAEQGARNEQGVHDWSRSIFQHITERIGVLSAEKNPSVGTSLAGIVQFLAEYAVGAADAAGNLVVDEQGRTILTASQGEQETMRGLYAQATLMAVSSIAMRIIDGEFRTRLSGHRAKEEMTNG